jgi:4-alpha-glucanotransferase
MGDIGRSTLAPFLDWCVAAGVSAWQVLPLVPPETEHWSPYSGEDALCGWPALLSLDDLVADGLLDAGAVREANARLVKASSPSHVDHAAVVAGRSPLLAAAADALLARPPSDPLRSGLDAWTAAHAWVADSALFHCLSTSEPGCVGKAWWEWPPALRSRDPAALAAAAATHSTTASRFTALQFLFDRQWGAVREAASARGIAIVGDMPIYVGGHSADVWAHRGLFCLDSDTGAPAAVSGVPPDAFSATGQLWGSPLYDWPAHAAEGFAWWARRVGRAGELYDLTRIDHFRGLAGYWAVRAGAENAMGGAWVAGPGASFFDGLRAAFGAQGVPVPALIAEDLGVITPDVVALRTGAARAPGMAVLQFAWGGPADGSNPHLPHNQAVDQVVYTGTHDNETSAGWVGGSANAKEIAAMRVYWGLPAPRRLRRWLGLVRAGRDPLLSDPAGAFIRSAWGSPARTAVAPMQDVLRLGNEARMNTPGTAGGGNWAWRMEGGGKGADPAGVWAGLAGRAAELRALATATGRLDPVQEAWRAKGEA